MAQTRGFVQRLKVTNSIVMAWAYIGPSPTDTELLIVMAPANLPAEDAATRGAIADALGAALASQTEVIAFHGDNSAEITALQIPAA
ncbi:MAG TPA: hypothetical protein VM450_01975 [Thermomicrobiales bacterium]|nr:hypothetical protein [Thermomicrobiales bacterium]